MSLLLITAQDTISTTLSSGGAEGDAIEGKELRVGKQLGSVLEERSEEGLAKEWMLQKNKQMGDVQ